MNLGRHVRGLEVVDNLLRDGAAVIGAGPCEVEAGKADAPVAAHEDVRRRDVAMDNLVRLKVLEEARSRNRRAILYLLVEGQRERRLFDVDAQRPVRECPR